MFILHLISVFLHWWNILYFYFLSGNLKRIVSILSIKYLDKWSQSDFTDESSGRASVEFYAECYLWSSIDIDDV